MDKQNLHNIIKAVDRNHNPWGVFIKYRGHSYIPIGPAENHKVQTYDFTLSGGWDYVLSVGTQVRHDYGKNGSQTIFSLRDAHDLLGGNDFGYNSQPHEQVDVSVKGAWNYHVFEVALELSHTVLKGIYLYDKKDPR